MSTTTEFEADMGQGSDYGRDARLRRIGMLAKQRREELGLGRVPFAAQAGVGSDSTIRDLEFGRVLPKGLNLRKIEKALRWRIGAIDDVMMNENLRASSLEMEDLDAYDSQPENALWNIPTVELLQEVIRRLTNPGAAALEFNADIDPRSMLGLAASGYRPEHLEDDEDEGGGVQPGANAN